MNLNKSVDFETKKMLIDKRFIFELKQESSTHIENSLGEQRWNDGDLSYIDISIFEVVMWLYEKHGIWIEIRYMDEVLMFGYLITTIQNNTYYGDIWKYNSPTEAYKAAIEYVLKHLI